MFLAKEKLQHVNSIAHEGKVVVFATDGDGTIWYTIKQDGFEDSYLNTPADQRTGWEGWKTLEFPHEGDDPSVIDKEKADLTDENDTSRFILRSRYRTGEVSAVAPVQLVSGMGHIYVFRQSKADATEASPSTLLVDRFVLDGMTNKLERKLQVRFKRSRQQHKPTGNQRKGSNGQLVNVDSLDFRDAENKRFYEPTTELSLIDNLHDGWFSVVLLPTNEHDNHRWHIFAYNSATQTVELTTIRASVDGLFDVKDYSVLESRPEAKGAMVPRSIPGLIRRTLDFNGVQVSNGLAATKYDIQREQQTREGMQLLKTATRVMLAVPTVQGPVAALSFAVAADGTLSQIDENPDGAPTLVRSNARDVLLPLNTLDEIKAIGDSTPPPEGTISKMERGEKDKVKITTADASPLINGDVVKITDTNHYNGHYVATNINGNTFDIAAAWVNGEMGDWKVVPKEESGLIFDGVVTAVERVTDGTLRVTAVNHGLEDGDEVQIVDTKAYNKNFPVRKLDDQHFTIEGIRWRSGEAVNLKLESRKRRGIMFNGDDEYIETPPLALTPPSEEFSFGYTWSAWVYVSNEASEEQAIVGLRGQEADATQIAKLQADDKEANDNFGYRVALSGDTALVGAHGEDTGGSNAGSAYILERGSDGTWSQVAKLQADDKEAGDHFGFSVALSGDTALVGAGGNDAGSAYLFSRGSDGTWAQTAKLQADDKEAGDQFGGSVALGGDTALVGAHGEDTGGASAGSAYLFSRGSDGTWAQTAKLQADDKAAGDSFGVSVALSGDTALVGARGEDTGGADAGSAYLFSRGSDGVWTQTAKLQADDKAGGDAFGYGVALSGNTALIGAFGEDTGEGDAGSAYLFNRGSAGVWTQVAKLQADDKAATDFFGFSVALSGNIALVGAYREDTGGGDAGSAYLFDLPLQVEYPVLAIIDNTVTLKVTCDDGIHQVADTAPVPTGQWVHYAGIIASDGTSNKTTLTLCKNGEQVGPPIEVASLPKMPENKKTAAWIGKALAGKIADVRIWDTPRTAQQIKDTMYLRLTGREVDLAGYWRLGAIAENKERKVVDFSIHGNDGVVHGDAFVSAITLSRTLGDGTTEAVNYRNDDLVAVSARATYLESFEFKTDAGVDPNDIDGKGGKLFTFSYWGKKSRSAQTRIDHKFFALEQSDFQALGEGWYSATCRFTVPDGVAMLRCFELAYVAGDWSTLEVRKHRIRLVSETITEARYTDHVTLETLADELPAVPEKLTELAQKEQEEAALLEEKRDLEERLALLDDLALLQQRLEQIKGNVLTLKGQEQQRYDEYQKEKNDPFNYWCYIASRHDSTLRLEVALPFVGFHRSTDQPWKFAKAGDGSYYICPKDKYPGYRWDCSNYMHVFLSPDADTPGQKWKLSKTDDINRSLGYAGSWGNDEYLFSNDFFGDDLYLDFPPSNLVAFKPFPGYAYQSFKLIKTAEVSNAAIDAAKARWEAKQQERKSKEQERDRLQEILDGSDIGQKTAWQNRLNEITNILLPAIQTAIAALNTALLNTINAVQQTPQAMPVVHTVSRGSQKGLITKGALLGFAAPASRLTALETCEGNVQLSYFDDRGCMRQTNFDATADSQNAAFEQWTPNALPVCLNFANSNDVLTLDPAVTLGNESTVEAWFAYPLPQTTLWNTLASSTDGTTQIVAYEGQWLGLRTDGFFHSSGYDLESLSRGWHHLAVVGNVEQGKATTTFYIDGKQVGETAQPRTALAFNGQAEYVQVADHTNSRHAITVSCWAKSNTENWNGDAFLVSKRDAYILCPVKDTTRINFNIYSGGWKSLGFTPDIDLTQWHHYAGTFDGNMICLYIDGVRVASSEVFTSPKGMIDADTGPLYLGRDDDIGSYFNGTIAEVRIWDHAQTEDQIQANLGLLLEGDEMGLVGYWRLTDASANDLSPDAHNGTLQGTPETVSVAAQLTGEVQTVGNCNTGAAPFGKVAEVRFWQTALSKEEVAVNSKTRLTGNEPGLAAYYPLNEATGTEVRDQTGNSHAGTVLGARWRGCVAPIGNLGHQVVQFDGKNDFVNVPALAVPQQQGTIEAWIYADYDASPSGYQTIVEFGNDSPYFGLQNGKLKLHHGAVSPEQLSLQQWIHVAAVWDAAGTRVFVDGLEAATGSCISPTGTGMGIGFHDGDKHFKGRISEVRIWSKARTQQEIQADRHRHLSGREEGLVGYWPLNEFRPKAETTTVLDLCPNQNHGTVSGAVLQADNTLPIGSDALVCNEYSTVRLDPVTRKKQAMMQRFFASSALGGGELLPEKRVELLELKWIGNAQFAPTLLGYIEGPPPIPSENLTVEDDYNGATSVELAMSEDVAFSWDRAQDVGLGGSIDGFLGGAGEIHAGVGMEQQVGEWKTGFKGHLDLGYQWQNESNINSSSSQSMTDRLELRGTQEPGVKFPHLGKRFIPKNVGYALVISSMADVFITRLKRSKRMVGYQVNPVDGIPPDVNTITFLMNPAYTMSGSLDGQTGSSATSNRFFQHVPEMRAQYGSLYPASYFRLKEAYDLKEKIDANDKRRASYFAQFNAGLVDETSLERNIDSGGAPQTISIKREEDKSDENLTEEEKQATQDAKLKAITDELGAATEQQSKNVKKKQAEIKAKIADQKTRVHATDSFTWWQKRMEDLQIRAGKRNIVNTYVWDADGGLRTEAQSFANTAEHTIGGSFALDAGLGAAGEAVAGAAVEISALVTINLTQTMSKTESRSKGFELNVDLSGVESRGITDYNDYPMQPGEKVDRYRFMSFYLEGTTNNFNDFFAYVVDPEWLASNDEEARALRQAQGKANKTWRVLHRVTYVERPALMGFGRDYRKQEQEPDVANQDLLEYLEARLTALNTKVDKLVPVSTQGSQTATAQSGESATTDEPAVNLNTDSVEVLEMLPGISLSLAQAIVETRQQQAFTSLEDIERVSGIGPSLRQKLDGLVTW